MADCFSFCLRRSLLPAFDDALLFPSWRPDHHGVNRLLRGYFVMGGGVGRHQAGHAGSEFLHLPFAGLLQLAGEDVKDFGRLMWSGTSTPGGMTRSATVTSFVPPRCWSITTRSSLLLTGSM